MRGSLFIIFFAAATLFATGVARADVSLPAFYDTVSKMTPEGKLGEVVKREEIATTVPGARAWRFAYVSDDVNGRKTLATAIVAAPDGPVPEGGRPVVSWAHGTTGTAENCGPSQVPNPAVDLNEYFLIGGNSWTDYGLPSLTAFIKDGYIVVGTDYQGLGGGGRHQYAIAQTQGRDAINAARAVASLPDLGAKKQFVVYGWSQGGGATLAAAGLGDYIAQTGTAADGLSALGFVAMAPDDVAVTMPAVTDEAAAEKALGGLAATFGDNVFNFSHYAMALWGAQAAYPDLNLADPFTDDGAKALDEILSDKCMHATSDTLTYNYGTNFKSLMRPARANALPWVKALVAGSVPPVKPAAPVMIFWGTADTVVPPVMGELYRAQMCKLGANVTRIQLPGAQTHFSTPGASAPYYVPWIEDRFAGKPLPDGCAGA